MSYLNIVISLEDFIKYSEEILAQNHAFLYVEKRDPHNLISKVLFFQNELNQIVDNYNDKNLNFFIATKKPENVKQSLYDDDICEYAIEGEGGRTTQQAVERISLRLISKTPDITIKKVFDAIKNKLKKDESFGMGVKGNSSIHKNYFYQKNLVGNKFFLTNIHNEKAAMIEIL